MLGYRAEYEKPYVFATESNYKPDWYLGVGAGSTRGHVYLEHFGIDRDGQTRGDIPAVDYNRDMIWKRGLHRQRGTQLLETYHYDFTEHAWHARLVLQLYQAGLTADPVARANSGEFRNRIGIAGAQGGRRPSCVHPRGARRSPRSRRGPPRPVRPRSVAACRRHQRAMARCAGCSVP